MRPLAFQGVGRYWMATVSEDRRTGAATASGGNNYRITGLTTP